MGVTELLLHPIRLRIVNAVFDGRPFTIGDLRTRLPDVAKATMYRHVGLLAEGGLIDVEGEERRRGAVERHYRLRRADTVIDEGAAAAMTLDDHRRGFTAVVAALLAEFDLYLDGPGADPTADMVSYRQGPLWLDDAEKAALIGDVVAVLRARRDLAPAPGRRPHLLTTILFPTPDPATG